MYPLVTQFNFLPRLSKEKLAKVRNLMSPQRLQMYRFFPSIRTSGGKRRQPLIKDILSETRRVGFIWKTLLTTQVREPRRDPWAALQIWGEGQTRAETYLLYWVVESPKPPRTQLSSPCRLDPAIVMEPPALIPAESRCVDETETRQWCCSNVILLLAMSFFLCFFLSFLFLMGSPSVHVKQPLDKDVHCYISQGASLFLMGSDRFLVAVQGAFAVWFGVACLRVWMVFFWADSNSLVLSCQQARVLQLIIILV